MSNFTNAKAITFLDTETISLNPVQGVDTLLSISFITDWDSGNISSKTHLIKMTPEKLDSSSQQALEINNYSDEAWKDSVTLESVAGDIAKSIAWGPLVGHNIQFDINHIVSSLESIGWRRAEQGERFDIEKKIYQIGYPIIDTCALAYLFVETEKQNLNVLREHMNISLNRAHDAKNDVEDCRQIFYHIMKNTTRD